MTDEILPLLGLRLRKLAYSLLHASCWRALSVGVFPTLEHVRVLRVLKLDNIIDVGANRGQFSLSCRLVHRSAPIIAFEPLPSEAAKFRKVHGQRRSVTLIESALGEKPGRATLHVSKKADSSSLLPIGVQQAKLFSGTDEIGAITVAVQRLDDLSDYWQGRSRQLLKLDVQGFELSVLRGAVETLKSCAYVYAECSEVPLYDGQALRPEVVAFLRDHGFVEEAKYNSHFNDGQLVQADYLFVRAKTCA